MASGQEELNASVDVYPPFPSPGDHAIRVTDDGIVRESHDGSIRALEASTDLGFNLGGSVNVLNRTLGGGVTVLREAGLRRPRITEDGVLRESHGGDIRVLEISERESSTLGGSVNVLNRSLGGEVTVFREAGLRRPRITEGGVLRESHGGDIRVLEISERESSTLGGSVNVLNRSLGGEVTISGHEPDVYSRGERITEDGVSRLSNDGMFRVVEWGLEKHYSDLSGSANVSQTTYGSSNLDGSIFVTASGNEDLGGSILVTASGYQSIPGSVNVIHMSHGDLGGVVNLVKPGSDDLDGSLIVERYGSSDLDGSVRIYEDKWIANLLGSVYVIPYDDLGGSVTIPRNTDLGGSVTITSHTDLGGSVTIPPGTSLDGSLFVTASGYLDLGGEVTVSHYSDLGGSVTIPRNTDLNGSVTIDVSNQLLGGMVTVGDASHADLSGSVVLIGGLGGSVTVLASGHQDLNGEMTVVVPSGIDLGGIVMIPARTDLGGQIAIRTNTDIGGETTVIAKRPDDVVVEANVDEATWQDEQWPEFSWDDPYSDTYPVVAYHLAWTDNPDYDVTISDTLVTGRSVTRGFIDPGVKYLHIKAVNSIGNLSANNGTFAVWYNHTPSAPGVPLLTEGVASAVTGDLEPWLSWGQATDEDTSDTIEYQIQVSTDIGFVDVVSEIGPIECPSILGAPGVDGEVSFPGEGLYYWRSRAWDGREFGPWPSGVGSCLIERTSEDLPGSVSICARGVGNLGGVVTIFAYDNLGGMITVSKDGYTDLGGSISINSGWDAELDGTLNVMPRSDLGGSAKVIRPSSLGGSVTVSKPSYDELDGEVNVCLKWDGELGGSVTLLPSSFGDLGGEVFISAVSDLSGFVTVYDTDHFGFIDDFSNNLPGSVFISRAGASNLYGSVVVVSPRPGPVAVTSSTPFGEWQENGSPTLEWTTPALNGAGISGFYTAIDQSESTDVTSSDSLHSPSSFGMTIDLETLSGAGSYWFHIAALGANGMMGETTHWNIMYNHIPSTPSTPMLANGENALSEAVVVSYIGSSVLSWGASTDVDLLDDISYELQFSTTPEFALVELELTGLGLSTTIPSGSLSYGMHYWRVRAWDGKQYSESWSPTAMLKVNTPPSRPDGLLAKE